MKTTLMILRFACLTLFFASAFAAEDLNRRMDAAPDGEVTIDNTAGSVTVRGWSRDEVEVTGELGRDVEELVFTRDDNEVLVKVRIPDSNDRDISSDLVVHVPENSSLNVSGVSTDINVRDVRGAQRLGTVSGDIDSHVYAADIDVDTVSGDVALQGEDQENHTHATSVSGDIQVQNLAGDIELNSVSGDLAVVKGHFKRVRAETTSSDIAYHAALAGDGRLDMKTINGDLDVIFDGDVGARFDIETFNGDIRNCFGPQPERTSQYTPGLKLNFTEGNGDSRVTIQTLNGDLRLCRN